MSRDSSASPSEGEILESGSEKANTSTNGSRETGVDRPSRTRVTISRSPSPYRALGQHRSRGLSRDRSRSPFRESRGAKRRHEADHYDRQHKDPRRFKVRYEDSKQRGSDLRQSSHRETTYQDSGYKKYDQADYRNTLSRSRDNRGLQNGYSERSSTLHKGPKKEHGYLHDKDVRSGNHSRRGQDERDHREGRVRVTNEQSVSDQVFGPIATAQQYHHAKTNNAQTPDRSIINTNGNRSKSAEYVPPLARGSYADLFSYSGGAVNPFNTIVEAIVCVPETQHDEAALIEERRKRREAIKARHRGQATPMLVQAPALEKDSEPNTPRLETQKPQGMPLQPQKLGGVDPLTVASPKSPLPFSSKPVDEQESPDEFIVAKDADLANSSIMRDSTRPEEEPSAADYDPTVDMQEDKIRHDQYQQQDAVSASVYDETKEVDQDVIIRETTAEQPTQKGVSDGFDMFAEDVDMFVDGPVVPRTTDKTSSKAVPVAQTQARDMSMLDDSDDSDGYYKIILGELLDGRYHVQSNLGKGMFSGVVRATDQKTQQLVAVKVVRNNETMKKAGLKEIEILQTLKVADPEDKKHLIRLERSFEHKEHLCMVFENLSINLREVLKKFGRDVGINLKAVRAYAQQMFLGLSLMRKCNIIHADLKPDNVLVNESRNGLKICDLGSASDVSDNEITQYLVSRFYRAPEIILGLPYDFAIDMWSVGCTLFELYTGKILFAGRSNNQMLRVMMECRGKFSQKMLRKAQFAGFHFDDMLNFRSIEKDRLTGKDSIKTLNFAKPTRDLRTRISTNVKGMDDGEVKEVNVFIDLLDRCLNLNPEKRFTPAEALKHPFILRQKV
ncbi:uncharacterized protein KY384_000665 [Bacidia gigantensis]|uniref:uncharacterized protein n=1 Tax=Bacidia gigantensis TaxID=2732470 RepID=UPI001D052ECA|nr:uncharacterized protein KY384_000665 [Bacidia gigantensis]KAG8525903.1 hypothetical protein KY384_000665 [Bacidia gigantensis]